jgi:hypothetical protein
MIRVPLPWRLYQRNEQKTYALADHVSQVSVRIAYSHEPIAELQEWLDEHDGFEFISVVEDDYMTGRARPDFVFIECHSDEDAVLFRLRWELV